jgi:hypothetical protein
MRERVGNASNVAWLVAGTLRLSSRRRIKLSPFKCVSSVKLLTGPLLLWYSMRSPLDPGVRSAIKRHR